jgi:hypothetical protein
MYGGGVALALTIFLAPSLCAQMGQRIGQVREIEGNWCRKATHLRIDDQIFLDDDIRYCSINVRLKDKIVIRFDRTPPYDRPYECSIPGICDQQAQLWLRGAFILGEIQPHRETELISALRFRHSLVPDAVLQGGRETRVPMSVLAKLSEGPYMLCHMSRQLKATECAEQPISLSHPDIQGVPGIYGIYRSADRDGEMVPRRLPSALVLITPSDSNLLPLWNLVPETFRYSTDRYSVFERWRYILYLTKRFAQHS